MTKIKPEYFEQGGHAYESGMWRNELDISLNHRRYHGQLYEDGRVTIRKAPGSAKGEDKFEIISYWYDRKLTEVEYTGTLNHIIDIANQTYGEKYGFHAEIV